ncbi:integrase [Robbsia andropogonis]|uniref:site-specific integrase n=1 Tax=Robbsia andropogonis TaxID=28092 RepID=UPI003D1DC9F1
MASISPRKLKDGSLHYQVIVSVSGFPRISETFATRAEAAWFGKETQAELEKRRSEKSPKAVPSVLPRPNLADFQKEKITDLLTTWVASDQCTKANRGNAPTVLRAVGHARVEDIDEHWVRDYIAKLSKTLSKNNRVFTASTIRRHLLMVSMAMQARARVLRLPKPDFPLHDSMLGRDWNVSRERRLEPDEEQALFQRFAAIKASVPSRNHWPLLVRLALTTCARLQELVLAEWSEFSASGKSWNIPAAHCKTGTARSVPLGPKARQIMKELQALRHPDSPRVFHPFSSPASVSVGFRAYVKDANITNFRFHDLRHEAISKLYMHATHLSERHLMRVVGHTNLKQTLAYTHLRADELADFMWDEERPKVLPLPERSDAEHDTLRLAQGRRQARIRLVREDHVHVRVSKTQVEVLDKLCRTMGTRRSSFLAEHLPRLMALVESESKGQAKPVHSFVPTPIPPHSPTIDDVMWHAARLAMLGEANACAR